MDLRNCSPKSSHYIFTKVHQGTVRIFLEILWVDSHKGLEIVRTTKFLQDTNPLCPHSLLHLPKQ